MPAETAVAAPRRARKTAGPTTPDPVEIAMEAEASGRAPAAQAGLLLQAQRNLIRWQTARERAAAVLAGAAALAALAAVLGLGAMAWRASGADGVIVRRFTAPAAFEEAGLGGEVLATRFMDRINAHQEASRGTALQSATGFSGSQGDAVTLAIPQTGISLADLDAVLRQWLGRETAITGNVSQMGETVVVTVRYGAQTPVRVTGPVTELEAMIERAADGVYAQADPIRAVFVQPPTPEGSAAREALLQRLRTRGSTAGADGWSLSASVSRDPRQALRYAAVSVRRNPDFPMGHQEFANASMSLGLDEAALQAMRRARRAMDGARGLRWNEFSYEMVRLNQEAQIAQLTGDFAAAARLAQRRMEIGASLGRAGSPVHVRWLASGHEIEAAQRELDTAALRGAPDALLPYLQAHTWAAAGRVTEALPMFARAMSALDEGDAEARAAGLSQSSLSRYFRLCLTADYALALARAGQFGAAEATIGPTPTNCYPCLRARAGIAELRRDTGGADRWFAAALRTAPSLPFAEAEWAAVRLARGEPADAARLASAAHAKAPRFADALEVWGEALLAQGDAEGAAQNFAKAAKLTPRWGRLHLKWGEALAAQGKAEQAQAKWRAAAGMDLTVAERERVDSLLRPRTT
jgi:tetratricopeptide (TPR) repeat protein